MATFILRPQNGGRDIAIPTGKTTIGRGPFLGVSLTNDYMQLFDVNIHYFSDHFMLIIS